MNYFKTNFGRSETQILKSQSDSTQIPKSQSDSTKIPKSQSNSTSISKTFSSSQTLQTQISTPPRRQDRDGTATDQADSLSNKDSSNSATTSDISILEDKVRSFESAEGSPQQRTPLIRRPSSFFQDDTNNIAETNTVSNVLDLYIQESPSPNKRLSRDVHKENAGRRFNFDLASYTKQPQQQRKFKVPMRDITEHSNSDSGNSGSAEHSDVSSSSIQQLLLRYSSSVSTLDLLNALMNDNSRASFLLQSISEDDEVGMNEVSESQSSLFAIGRAQVVSMEKKSPPVRSVKSAESRLNSAIEFKRPIENRSSLAPSSVYSKRTTTSIPKQVSRESLDFRPLPTTKYPDPVYSSPLSNSAIESYNSQKYAKVPSRDHSHRSSTVSDSFIPVKGLKNPQPVLSAESFYSAKSSLRSADYIKKDTSIKQSKTSSDSFGDYEKLEFHGIDTIFLIHNEPKCHPGTIKALLFLSILIPPFYILIATGSLDNRLGRIEPRYKLIAGVMSAISCILIVFAILMLFGYGLTHT